MSLLLAGFVLAVLFVAAGPAAAAPGEGTVNFTLEPTDATVTPNGSQSYNVTVEGPDNGISGYSEVFVRVADPSVATITDFEEYATGTEGPLSGSEIQDNGSTLLLDAALLDASYEAAPAVTIASVTVTATGGANESTAIEFVRNETDENQNVTGNDNIAYEKGTLEGATLSVVTPATFQVRDLNPQNGTVRNGTTLDVSAVVENTGDRAGTQAVTLELGTQSECTFSWTGPLSCPTITSETVTLAAGANTTVEFRVDTGSLGTGSYTTIVRSANNSTSGTIDVVTVADIQVSSLDPRYPTVAPGARLNLTATVENTGNDTGTQYILLRAPSGFIPIVTRSAPVTLAPGEQTQVQFRNIDMSRLEGEFIPAPPVDYTVRSNNDSMSGEIEVAKPPDLQVTDIRPVNTSLSGTAVTSVTAEITNTGQRNDFQDIELRIEGKQDIRVREVTEFVSAGESKNVTFGSLDFPDVLPPGSYTLSVSTANDTRSGYLDIVEPEFVIEDIRPRETTVGSSGIEVDIRNRGRGTGTQRVTLSVDGTSRGAKQPSLAPFEWRTLVFENVVDELGPGFHSLEVSTPDDTETRPLQVRGQASVDLRPVDETVRVGRNTTVQAVVTGSHSIRDYDIDIGLNSTAASVVAVESVDETVANASLGPSAVSLRGGGLDTRGDGTVIANLTLQFNETGTVSTEVSGLSVRGNDLAYATETRNAVVSTVGPPPVVRGRLPQDPDADGVYEDVRGDGEANLLDVQALFDHLGEVGVTPEFFDLSDDGAVNILDVQALFREVR
jgi:hypothetical protein